MIYGTERIGMKVVFWDWNGTLVNDAPVLCEVFNVLVSARGYSPVTLEEYRELYRHPVREMYERIGFDFEKHPFEKVAREWNEVYRQRVSSIQLHGDSISTLEALRKRGSRQAVLSALPHEVLLESVATQGVGHFFDQVAGIAHDRGDSKVQEGIELANLMGAKGEDITIVGDSSHDAEVARELSARCILVARGGESRRRLESNGFPVVDSFEGLLDGLVSEKRGVFYTKQ
jgi:phosphoglycolate phosphatase